MVMRVVLHHDVRTFARFAAVGLSSNALFYFLYLVLAAGFGLRPVLAATVGWMVGLTISFLSNRSWTFGHTGPRAPAFLRYGLLYATAYVLNILLLVLLVDQAGLPDELVQGVLIVVFGLSLFVGQRYWVFRPGEDI
jgi:putative flippase GtrA